MMQLSQLIKIQSKLTNYIHYQVFQLIASVQEHSHAGTLLEIMFSFIPSTVASTATVSEALKLLEGFQCVTSLQEMQSLIIRALTVFKQNLKAEVTENQK